MHPYFLSMPVPYKTTLEGTGSKVISNNSLTANFAFEE